MLDRIEVIGDEDLLIKYQEKLERLTNKEYKALGFEKLHGHEEIYSIKVGGSDRLLLIFLHVHGKPCFLVLEEILSHDYHKSSFLMTPGVLEAYKDKHILPAVEQITFLSDNGSSLPQAQCVEGPADAKLEHLETQEKIDYKSIIFNKKFMALTRKQQDGLNVNLVSGGPGTGKSLVGLEALLRAAFNANSKNKLRLLYVTKATQLTQDMEKRFWTHPHARQLQNLIEHGYLEVDFKSYQELFEAAQEEDWSEDMKDDGSFLEMRTEEKSEKNIFNTWLLDYKKRLINQEKARGAQKEHSVSPLMALFQHSHWVMQEFRIIDGKDQEKYYSLGESQSNFKEAESRKALFEAFKDFRRTYPEALSCMDSVSEERKYHKVVVDEVQDLTQGQVRRVFNLALYLNIMFLNSKVQRLEDSHSNEHDFYDLLPPYYKMTQVILTRPFRNPGCVTELINHVILTQRKVAANFKKVKSDALDEPQPAINGEISWEIPSTVPPKFFVPSHNRVFITRKSNIASVMKTYGSPMVFTIKDLKGLEFPEVVLVDFFNRKVCRTISRILENKIKSLENSEEIVRFDIFFQKLVTALSRAKVEVLIIQETIHEIRALIEEVKRGLPKPAEEKTSDVVVDVKPESAKPPSEDQWLSTARMLFDNKNVTQASGILKDKMNKPEAEIQKIFADWSNLQKKPVVANKQNLQGKSPASQETHKTDPKKTPKGLDSGSIKTLSEASVNTLFQPAKKEETKPAGKSAYKIRLFDILISGNKDNKQNLTKLFDSKSFESIFFGHDLDPINKGSSLFRRMIENPEKATILRDFLQNNDVYSSKFMAHLGDLKKHIHMKNVPDLLWLILNTDAFTIFKEFLSETKFLIPLANQPLDLFKLHRIVSDPFDPLIPFKDVSIFSYLAEDEERFNLIKGLIALRPSLIEIMLQILSTYSNNVLQQNFEMQQILFAMATNEPGIEMLDKMLTECQTIIPMEFAKALIYPFSAYSKSTVAQLLHRSIEGQSFLNKLWQSYPELRYLIEQFIPDDIKKRDEEKPDSILGDTVFKQPRKDCRIVQDLEVQELINKIINQCNMKTLKKLFNHKDFDIILFEIAVSNYKNLLCFFTKNEKEMSMLIDYLTNKDNINIAKKITDIIISRKYQFQKDSFVNYTPLFYFASSQKGCYLLAYIISIQTTFFIDNDAFYNKNNGRSVFDSMIQITDKGSVLLEIFIKNPHLLAELTGKLMIPSSTIPIDGSVKKGNINNLPLFYLCQNIELFKYILSKIPAILSDISLKHLGINPLGNLRGLAREQTAVYQLAQSNDGAEIFYQILIATISIATAKQLYRLLNQPYSKEKDGTTLALFKKHPAAYYKISALLHAWHPYYFHNVIAETEPSRPNYKITFLDGFAHEKSANLLINSDVFVKHYLVDTDIRRELIYFCRENPSAYKYFTSQYFSQINAHSNMPMLFTILCSHIYNPENEWGASFFASCLKETQDVGLNKEALFKRDKNNYSSFLMLAKDKIQCLEILYEKNRTLFENMHVEDLYSIVTYDDDIELSQVDVTNHTSVFYFLTQSESNQKFLDEIYTINPELGLNVAAKMLSLDYKDPGDDHPMDSIFQNLVKTKIGCKILSHILKKSQTPFDQATSLRFLHKPMEFSDKNALHYLKKYEENELITLLLPTKTGGVIDDKMPLPLPNFFSKKEKPESKHIDNPNQHLALNVGHSINKK